MANRDQGLSGLQVWQRLIAGNMRFVQGLFQGRNMPDLRGTLTLIWLLSNTCCIPAKWRP
jgi:hypothetical protein